MVTTPPTSQDKPQTPGRRDALSTMRMRRYPARALSSRIAWSSAVISVGEAAFEAMRVAHIWRAIGRAVLGHHVIRHLPPFMVDDRIAIRPRQFPELCTFIGSEAGREAIEIYHRISLCIRIQVGLSEA